MRATSARRNLAQTPNDVSRGSSILPHPRRLSAQVVRNSPLVLHSRRQQHPIPRDEASDFLSETIVGECCAMRACSPR